MKAIDVHAHLNTKEMMEGSLGRYNEAMQKYYKFDLKTKTSEEMADDFIKADVKGILMGWDAETGSGLPKFSNDSLAETVKGFPSAFIGGFAGVDPWKGEMAIKEAERAVKELGLMGLKFQPAVQAFYPNDRRFYPLWEKCAELKVPVQFHTGTTGIGAGLPGGMGIKLKYCQPVFLDDIAADYPELTIIACHMGSGLLFKVGFKSAPVIAIAVSSMTRSCKPSKVISRHASPSLFPISRLATLRA